MTAGTDSLTGKSTSARLLSAELERAYRDSSEEQLAAFFQRWHDTVQSIDVGDVAGPLEGDLYAVYLTCFRPFNLDDLAGSFLQNSEGTYSDTYVGVQYVIVPTSLRFQIGSDGAEQTLENFRPPVDARTAKVLFLTPAYRKALETFLDCNLADYAANDRKEPDDHIDETIERLEFLDKQVRIELGHWGGWDLLTYPSDVYVEFNKTRTEAHVNFKMFSLHGMATIKRESGQWHMVDSGIFAIE